MPSAAFAIRVSATWASVSAHPATLGGERDPLIATVVGVGAPGDPAALLEARSRVG